MTDTKPLLEKIKDLAQIIRLRESELDNAFRRMRELEEKNRELNHILAAYYQHDVDKHFGSA